MQRNSLSPSLLSSCPSTKDMDEAQKSLLCLPSSVGRHRGVSSFVNLPLGSTSLSSYQHSHNAQQQQQHTGSSCSSTSSSTSSLSGSSMTTLTQQKQGNSRLSSSKSLSVSSMLIHDGDKDNKAQPTWIGSSVDIAFNAVPIDAASSLIQLSQSTLTGNEMCSRVLPVPRPLVDTTIGPVSSSSSSSCTPPLPSETTMSISNLTTPSVKKPMPVSKSLDDKRKRNTLSARRSREKKAAQLAFFEESNKALVAEQGLLLGRIKSLELERTHWMVKEQEYQSRVLKMEDNLNTMYSLLLQSRMASGPSGQQQHHHHP